MRAKLPEAPQAQAALTVAELAKHPAVGVDQTAAFLELHTSTVRGAIADGSIPSFRVGRRILVPTAALLKLVGAA